MTDTLTRFDEYRALLAELPAPETGEAATERMASRQPDLGVLEPALVWLARWQGRPSARVEQSRVALYAGRHGIAGPAAAHQSTAHPSTAHPGTARALVDALAEGASPSAAMARVVNADLQVFELDLEHGTGDYRTGPALAEAEAARAIAYGMMAVQAGIDVLVLAGFGEGSARTAAALRTALGATAGEEASADAAVVRARTGGAPQDAFDWLAEIGGLETCAMVGAMLAARLAKVPVLAEGPAAGAALAVLAALGAGLADHVWWLDNSTPPTDTDRSWQGTGPVVTTTGLTAHGAMLTLAALRTGAAALH